MRCYHFCTKEFYKELLVKKEIVANNLYKKCLGTDINVLAEDYVKDYVFRIKNINNNNGMFFAWSNPSYKGEVIENKNGKYVLLELEIDEHELLKTHYENWCSLGMDLYEADGDFEVANDVSLSYGVKNGLEGAYEAIYILDDFSEVQILIPTLKYSYIKSSMFVEKKNI